MEKLAMAVELNAYMVKSLQRYIHYIAAVKNHVTDLTF